MEKTDSAFKGSIPELYDRYLGPLIFEPYAADLAYRLRDFDRGELLETAAGTGIVTQALARALAPDVALTATDLNQPMLDFAAKKEGMERVTFRQADAQDLPFEDGRFDAVVCQFGVMFFPDKKRAYAEAWRVLKPGGRFLFNVWDSLSENPIPETIAQAVAALYPKDPPGFIGRVPYAYFDLDAIRAALAAASFTHIRVETLPFTTTAPTHHAPAAGFCQGSPLRLEIEARDPNGVEAATEAATRALERRFGPAPISAPIRAHIVEARK